MCRHTESLSELATEFEEYLKNHDDNKMLDLTEIDITTEQLQWVLDKSIEKEIIDSRYLCNEKILICSFDNEYKKDLIDFVSKIYNESRDEILRATLFNLIAQKLELEEAIVKHQRDMLDLQKKVILLQQEKITKDIKG